MSLSSNPRLKEVVAACIKQREAAKLDPDTSRTVNDFRFVGCVFKAAGDDAYDSEIAYAKEGLQSGKRSFRKKKTSN